MLYPSLHYLYRSLLIFILIACPVYQSFGQDLQKVKELTAKAEELVEAGEYEDALKVLDEVRDILGSLQGRPKELYDLAQNGIKARDAAIKRQKLEEEYNQLIRDGDDLLALGYYEKALNKYLEALELLDTPEVQEKIADLKREHGEGMAAVYDEKARKYEDEGDIEGAVEWYESAQSINEESWREKKIRQLKERIDNGNALIQKAEEQLNLFRYSAALAIGKKAEALLPLSSQAIQVRLHADYYLRLYLMDSLLQKNNPKAALRELKQSLRLFWTEFTDEDVNNIANPVTAYTWLYNGRRLYQQLGEQVIAGFRDQTKLLDPEIDFYDKLIDVMNPESGSAVKVGSGDNAVTESSLMNKYLDYIIDETISEDDVKDAYRLFTGKGNFKPDGLMLNRIDTLRAHLENKIYKLNLQYLSDGVSKGIPALGDLNTFAYDCMDRYTSTWRIPAVDETMIYQLVNIYNGHTERLIRANLFDSALKYLDGNYRELVYPLNVSYVGKIENFSNEMVPDAKSQQDLLKKLPYYGIRDKLFLPPMRNKPEIKSFFGLLDMLNRRAISNKPWFIVEIQSPVAFGSDKAFDQMPYQYRYYTSSGPTYNDPAGVDTRTIRYKNPVRAERISLRYTGNIGMGKFHIPVGIDLNFNRLSAAGGEYEMDNAKPRAVGSALPFPPGNTVVSVIDPFRQNSNAYRITTVELMPSVRVLRYVRLMAGLQRVSLRYHPTYNLPNGGAAGQLGIDQLKPVTGVELLHPTLLGNHTGLMLYGINQAAVFHSDQNRVSMLPEKDQKGTGFVSLNPMSYRAGAFVLHDREEWGFKVGVELQRVRVNYAIPSLGSSAYFRGISRTAATVSLRRKF